MTWKYKLVEYNTTERKEIIQNIERVKNDSVKKIAQQLNWKEKEKAMTEEEREEFLKTRLYPEADQTFLEELKKAYPELGFLTRDDVSTRAKDVLPDHLQYLELKINSYASQGWQLDKIRTYRGTPNDGYIIFKKEGKL
ncbi:MAG: hypothetical protein ACXADY_17805 [Candidatus Hodarchaeales archaeon]|jgi:hypothetical protein